MAEFKKGDLVITTHPLRWTLEPAVGEESFEVGSGVYGKVVKVFDPAEGFYVLLINFHGVKRVVNRLGDVVKVSALDRLVYEVARD